MSDYRSPLEIIGLQSAAFAIWREKDGKRKCKTMYGKIMFEHLGGKLGERLFSRLVALKWFVRDEEKRTHYHITELGMVELEKLGVDVFERR